MNVLGIDQSLTSTGVVVISDDLPDHPRAIHSRVIKTHPRKKGLKGIEYEKDVMERCAFIAMMLNGTMVNFDIELVAIESVPFAKGWRSGVASNSLKGALAAMVGLSGMIDIEDMVVVDPKVVKKVIRGYDIKEMDTKLFNGKQHTAKDIVVAWVYQNRNVMMDGGLLIREYGQSRSDREAIADAYCIAEAALENWA